MAMTFVLVHGNWHCGSAWDGVAQRLDQLGHIAYAPTVAGHGTDLQSDIGHHEAAQSVVEFIIDRDLADFVLVGHSGGGTTISKVAEAIPDRIRRLVYLSGFVLKDGESQVEFVPAEYRKFFADAVAASDDGRIPLPFDMWRNAFINDADDSLARSTYEMLCPEPWKLITDPVELPNFYSLDIPKSYILPTEDISLPRESDWGWHPKATSRLGEPRFLEVSGSHEVMFTNPRGLATALIAASID